MMRCKSQYISFIRQFHAYVRTQFNSTIQIIRSDNAKEICDGESKTFYLRHGITHQTSCRDTPQQNGVVERKHRHLLEVARALSFQSNLPSCFWGECVQTAAYLINRSPLSVLGHISPYEKLCGEPPNLTHLRSFGCLCYVSTLKHNRSKFQSRADPSIFVGYSLSQKAYKTYNPTTNSFVISRDVTFREHHFPYHSTTPPTSPLSTFYLPTSTPFPTYDDTYLPPNPFIFPSRESTNTPTPIFSSSDGSPISSTIPATSSPPPISLVVDISQPPIEPLRKSTRVHRAPSHLQDFVCSTAHWCNLVHFHSLPPVHQSFLASHTTWVEPRTYTQASKDPLWIAAMENELQALQNNHTWDLVPLPHSKKPVGCKWVYKIKLKADGSLERYKARLVAKGYTQEYGVDFYETFSPVVRMTTIRCILAVAASKQWPLHQLDVNNAFLHGDLHEDVYMLPPEGLSHSPGMVCKLRKSLYGLKQASRQWFAKLTLALTSQGFCQSKLDYSLFIHKAHGSITVVAIYVDDIIITGNDPQFISSIKSHLHHEFSIKDLGRLSFFLGLELTYSTNGIIVTQTKFTKELLRACNIPTLKPHITPLPLHHKLSATDSPLYPNPTLYRSLVGKLNFLTHTRPDLSYSVQALSQHMQSPAVAHFDALIHTLGYLSATMGQGILLSGSDNLTLQAYSDSDWGACPDTRRSISGFVLLLGQSPISWKSKKQATVSRSSSEAEYRSMAYASSEVVWLVRLLEDLGITSLKPVTLHCDNMSALHIAQNPVFHERTKHLEIDCHFTREKVMEGLLQLTYLPTTSQLADIFTKILPSGQFHQLLTKLGMFFPAQFEGG